MLDIYRKRGRNSEFKSAKTLRRKAKTAGDPQAVFRRFVKTLEKLQARAGQNADQALIKRDATQ